MKKTAQNPDNKKKALVFGGVIVASLLGYAVYNSFKAPVSAAEDIAQGDSDMPRSNPLVVGGDYMPPNTGGNGGSSGGGTRNGGSGNRPNVRTPKTPVVRQWQSDVAWPLKRGSNGSRVLAIQQALNQILVGRIKPLVLDGMFGTGTETALRSAGYSISVPESTYNAILQKAKVLPKVVGTGTKPTVIAGESKYKRALRLGYKDKEHIEPAQAIYNALTSPVPGTGRFGVVKKYINKAKGVQLVTNIARAYNILFGEKLNKALAYDTISKLYLREEISLLNTLV